MKSQSTSTSAGWATAAAIVVLMLAGLWAYRGSFSAPFTFDDEPAIINNPTIRHLGDVGRVLAGPAEKGSTAAGRPLVNLSLALNYAWGGLEVRGYHEFNLAIHLLAGLVLFGIVRRTRHETLARSATGMAFLVALIWMLHPLQTESVTFVAQRAESMMGLFYLLTVYCFIRHAEKVGLGGLARPFARDNLAVENMPGGLAERTAGRSRPALPRNIWAALSILFCLMGMATKEVMASAPLMVFLYDRTFVAGSFREAWKRRWRYYLCLAATWLLLGWLVLSAGGHRSITAGFGNGVSAWVYALTQCRAILLYLKLAFWPHPLVFDYGIEVTKRIGDVIPQAVGLLLLLAGTAIALWRRPVLGFLGAWFFLILAPSSSFVPVVTQTMAEHRMYLPLAAVVALVVCGGYGLLARLGGGAESLPSRAGLRPDVAKDVARSGRSGSRARISVFALFLILAAGLGHLTARRNQDYRSAFSLWEDTLAKQPGSVRAHYNLGVLLSLAGRDQEAMVRFQEAVSLRPDFTAAHLNLGDAWAATPGRLNDAIAEYREALRLDPNFAEAHINLGSLWSRMPGRLNDAVAEYQKALSLKPDSYLAHFNLGHAWLQVPGKLNDAIAQFEAALRLNPDYAEAHLGLAVALLEIPNRAVEAAVHLKTVLRLQPGNDLARQFLAELQASGVK